MLSACAVRLKDRWLVHPELKSVSGLLISRGPFNSLPTDADPATLGGVVRSALLRAEGTIPNPTDWKAISAPRLAAAGVKSESAFQRQSKLIRISANASTIELTPTWNGGASGDDKGFHQLEEVALFVASNCTDIELGEAVYEALSVCF